MDHHKVVIIGTGLAGYMLAKEFRKLDNVASLALITKNNGEFYSKPQISNAFLHRKKPDELVMSDVNVMREQLNAEIYTHSEVVSIDSHAKEIIFRDNNKNEHRLTYEKLILANGATKIPFRLQGDAAHDVLSVNDLDDYRVFRQKIAGKKRIAIIGAGLVGCEFANDLINDAFDVTLISAHEYPLMKFTPKEIGEALKTVFSEKKIRFCLSSLIKTIHKNTSDYDIVLSDDNIISVDAILFAGGIEPDLILAKSAGVETNIGVVVDSYLQTNKPDIYALGDCAEINGELKMYIAPLLQCARALAQTLAGNPQQVVFPVMPVVVKTPSCPVVVLPPPADCVGAWEIISDGVNCRALFYDNEMVLRGYALSGDETREKMRCMQSVGKKRACV